MSTMNRALRGLWRTCGSLVAGAVAVGALSAPATAQPSSLHHNNWTFGANCAVSWDADGNATAGTNPVLSTVEGVATWSDPETGQLVLFTDGITAWNGSNEVISAGSLGGDPSAAQSGVIVPVPGAPDHFYVVAQPINMGSIKYTRFNMTSAPGVQVGSPIVVPSTSTTGETLGVMGHGNGTDYWLFSKDQSGLLRMQISSSGISAATAINAPADMPVNGVLGQIAPTNSGDRVAFSSGGSETTNSGVLVADVDRCSGTLSNFEYITIPGVSVSTIGGAQTTYGVAWSSDDTKLYVQIYRPSPTVLQIDTTDGNKISELGRANGTHGGMLSLAVDGKIYVGSLQSGAVIGVIENPNLPYNAETGAPGFDPTGLALPGCTAHYGLPTAFSAFADVFNGAIVISEPIGGVASPTVGPNGTSFAPDGAAVTVTVTEADGTPVDTCGATVLDGKWACGDGAITLAQDTNYLVSATVDTGCQVVTDDSAFFTGCLDTAGPLGVDVGCNVGAPSCDPSLNPPACAQACTDSGPQRSRHADTWHFGEGCRMSWDENGENMMLAGDAAINTGEGSASFSDPKTGVALIYSDGRTVWDGAHNVVATGLAGDPSSLHSAVFAPVPGAPGNLYVFTHGDANSTQVTYQQFDVSSGTVPVGPAASVTTSTTVNNAVSLSAEGMIYVSHANQVDGWLLVSGQRHLTVIPLTLDGLGTPVHYPTTGSNLYWSVFAMNHAGTQLMYSTYNNNVLYAFDFDSATGIVSGEAVVATGFRQMYGGVFSPDDSKFYFSTLTEASAPLSRFRQIDLSNNNAITTLSSQAGQYTHGDARLAPDGKIYVAGRESRGIHVLDNPNAAGAAAGFTYNGVTIPEGCLPRLGLAQVPSATADIHLDLAATFVNPPAILSAADPLTLTGSANAPDGATVEVGVEGPNGFEATCTATVEATAWACDTDNTNSLAVGDYTAIAVITSGDSRTCEGHTFTVTCADTRDAGGLDAGCTPAAPSCNTTEGGPTCGPCTDDACTTAPMCDAAPLEQDVAVNDTCVKPVGETQPINPIVEWATDTFADASQYNQVMMTPVVGNLTDDNGDGVIDADDIPDVVFTRFAGGGYRNPGRLTAISGADGAELWTVATISGGNVAGGGGVVIGDLDGNGRPEVCTKLQPNSGIGCVQVAAPSNTPTTPPTDLWRSTQCLNAGWGVSNLTIYPAMADMDGDGMGEVIVGQCVLNAAGELVAKGPALANGGGDSFAANMDDDPELELVDGGKVFDMPVSGTALVAKWTVTGAEQWGTAAVADLDGDGKPEHVVSDLVTGRLIMYDPDAATDTDDIDGFNVQHPADVQGTNGIAGGAPTVADFDGDGEPEIGVAAAFAYLVYEADGTLLWRQESFDGSARTGSSVFDFDGDGAAEVIYADELNLYILDGATGAKRAELSEFASATLYENPVVVDVDNDGESEIIVASNNYGYPGEWTGIRALGSADIAWSGARPVYNQHAYNISNINDDLTIPATPEPNWEKWNNFRAAAAIEGLANTLSDVFVAGELGCADCLDDAATAVVSVTVMVGNEGLLDASNVIVSLHPGALNVAAVASTTVATVPSGKAVPVIVEMTQLQWGAGDLYVQLTVGDSTPECDSADNAANFGTWPTLDDVDMDQVADVCDACVVPQPEICDGIDNNCDGTIDAADPELVIPVCEETLGVCAGALKPTTLCQGDAGWAICGDGDYANHAFPHPYEPGGETTCDFRDNDCDNSVDEDLGLAESCTGGVGACMFTGTLQCDAGGGVSCVANIAPAPMAETCDAIDNDCDGEVDEGAEGGSVCPTIDTEITDGPDPVTSEASADFEYTDPLNALATMFECQLDGGLWTPCDNGTASYTDLPEGAHTLLVRSVGGDGLPDGTPAFYTWTIDKSQPDTTIVVAPQDPSQQNTATFVFACSVPDPLLFTCAVDPVFDDQAPPIDTECGPSKTFVGLGEGQHTLIVFCTNQAGTPDPTPAVHTWTIDTIPPDTSVTCADAVTKASTVSFEFESNDAEAFQCRVDDGMWASCSSPFEASVGEGDHLFQVAAIDANDNVDPSPAICPWRVDQTRPNTTISIGPDDPSQSPTATFGFTCSEPSDEFWCALDARQEQPVGDNGASLSFVPCDAAEFFDDLDDGPHILSVYCVDEAGNRDLSPAEYTWLVDSTFPDTAYTDTPDSLVSPDDTNTFGYADPTNGDHTHFDCRLDDGEWAPCDDGAFEAGALEIGTHTLEVRACQRDIDQCDPTPAVYTWEVVDSPCPLDQVAPAVTCPENFAVGCVDGFGAEATVVGSATDACEPVTIGSTAPEAFAIGETAVVLSATDGNGNQSSCVTVVSVEDTLPPTISCPNDVTLNTPADQCGVTMTLDAPTVDDVCFGDDALTVYGNAPPTFGVGETVVTLSALDPAGNVGECNVTVTVVDNVPLVLTCETELTVAAPADTCTWSGTLQARATDNCAVDAIVIDESNAYAVGTHQVLFEGQDESGNSDSCTTALTVEDVTPPTVDCGTLTGDIPSVIALSGADACGAALTIASPTCELVAADGTVTALALGDCPATFGTDTIEVTGRLADGALRIRYTAQASDPSGNLTEEPCSFDFGADADADGIVDEADNCPLVANTDQGDGDGDGVGDVCDNCADLNTSNLTDSDGDGVGDLCDDADADGVLEMDDNCPDTPNAGQEDVDQDGTGDACDDVVDGVAAEGGGGCTSGGSSLPLPLALASLALLMVLRRRRTYA